MNNFIGKAAYLEKSLGKYGIELPQEFLDVFQVLVAGVDKGYAPNGWMKGEHFNERDNFASIARHNAENYAGSKIDPETGLPVLLHVACRALMAYTLDKRGATCHKSKTAK